MTNTVKVDQELNSKQKMAIQHLANGISVTQTARKVGVSRQTIGNWMKNPTFEEELKSLRNMKFIELADMYHGRQVDAFNTLTSIMLDKGAKKSDRIRAAVELKNESHRLRETIDLEDRISQLEQAIEEERNERP